MTEPVHFLQIWIIPKEAGLRPGYEQRSFDLQKNSGGWIHIVASDGGDGAVKVHQDVELYLAAITKEQKLNYRVKTGRQAWLQITRGVAAFNGTSLAAGDGAAVSKEVLLQIDSSDNAEVLLFDCRKRRSLKARGSAPSSIFTERWYPERRIELND